MGAIVAGDQGVECLNYFSALFPTAASTNASEVDAISLGLLVICGLIVVLVFGLIVFFGIKYRKGSPYSRAISYRQSGLLEWSWTFGTFAIFLALFLWGARLYFRMHVTPPGAIEISVIAKQWMWNFQHSGGYRELNELHIPVNQPIVLTMTSQDVVHSLFVPAFRIKQDVLPARYTKLWFQATLPGEYHLFCSQYCGTSHAEMRGKVIVMAEPDFGKWMVQNTSTTLKPVATVSAGEKFYQKLGCASCHEQKVAPSFNGLFGSMVTLTDGRTVRADENYLRDCILKPETQRVKGFDPVMPSFRGQIAEQDLLQLIDYIKSLGTQK